MKTALKVWLVAALAECLIYAFILGLPETLVVLVFALIGGFPGMLLFAFGLELIHMIWDEGRQKWIAIIFAALLAANGTLFLFLSLFQVRFDELPFFPIVNVAALAGLASVVPYIRRKYFIRQPAELLDVTQQANVYQFHKTNDTND